MIPEDSPGVGTPEPDFIGKLWRCFGGAAKGREGQLGLWFLFFYLVKMSWSGSIPVIVVWEKSRLDCGYTKKTENRTSQKIILFENVGAKWFYIFTIYNSKWGSVKWGFRSCGGPCDFNWPPWYVINSKGSLWLLTWVKCNEFQSLPIRSEEYFVVN